MPEPVTFRTKPQLAKVMLSRALAAHVPMHWVTGDEIYGNDRPFRRWLEAHALPQVLAVKRTEGVWSETEGGLSAGDRGRAGRGAAGERLAPPQCGCRKQGTARL